MNNNNKSKGKNKKKKEIIQKYFPATYNDFFEFVHQAALEMKNKGYTKDTFDYNDFLIEYKDFVENQFVFLEEALDEVECRNVELKLFHIPERYSYFSVHDFYEEILQTLRKQSLSYSDSEV